MLLHLVLVGTLMWSGASAFGASAGFTISSGLRWNKFDCDNCRLKNGVGYKPFPGDCTKYIQCDNSRVPHIRQCPYNLFWDQFNLVCNFPRFVNCSQKIPTTRKPPYRPPVYQRCDGSTRAVRGDNSKFEKYTRGGWVLFSCPPGTVYNSFRCFCDHGYNPNPTPWKVCKAELYLPFNNDVRDYSGNHLYVENEGVYPSYVGAFFKGYGGLRVPRFSNMDFRSTLQISFFYRSFRFPFYPGQALVSNGDCGKFGSVYIISIYRYILFRVTNEYGYVTYLSLPNYSLYSWTYVSLTIHGGYMYARVGFRYTYTSFRGNIAKSQCALQVGRGYGYRNYFGFLDELRVFICKPSPFYNNYHGHWHAYKRVFSSQSSARSAAQTVAQTGEQAEAQTVAQAEAQVDEQEPTEDEEMEEMVENLDEEVFQEEVPEDMEVAATTEATEAAEEVAVQEAEETPEATEVASNATETSSNATETLALA